MRHPLAFVLSSLSLLLAGPARAQDITFAFTDLTSCASGTPRDLESEENGSDQPIICPDPSGVYTVTEYYSAYDIHRDISLKNDSHFALRLRPTKERCPVATYGKNLEWRMKGGKPFAVIQRITCYALNKTESGPGKRLAEYLLVKGLKGHEAIDGVVNTKTKDANDKARALADAGLRWPREGSRPRRSAGGGPRAYSPPR